MADLDHPDHRERAKRLAQHGPRNSFQFAWSDFIWPLVISSGDRIATLQLGLAVLGGADGTQWSLLMASAVVATLPLLALFVLLQRMIVTGISFGVGK